MAADEDDAPDEAKGRGGPAPVELRFRAFAGDGRQIIGAPAELARAVPPPPRLSQPFFGHAAYQPGDKARISVAAKGVLRGAVKLVVEKQAGGGWEGAGELSAAFVLGTASATWDVPDLPPGGKVQFRVRAVAPFGQQTSDPITVERQGELTEPSFSHAHPKRGSHFDHGDEATLRVVAKGLDGRLIRFIVEQGEGGKWSPLATLTAPVARGEATARLVVQHPVLAKSPTLAALGAAKPLQIRFHAELVQS